MHFSTNKIVGNNSGNYIKYRIYEITKLIWGNVKHSLIQMQSANVMLVAYVLFCIGTMNGGAITTNKIDIQLSSFFRNSFVGS